jgi:hypothetical protein
MLIFTYNSTLKCNANNLLKPEIKLADINSENYAKHLQLSYNTEITAETYSKPSTKITWTPDVPWKPQCGENQLRGGFIGS